MAMSKGNTPLRPRRVSVAEAGRVAQEAADGSKPSVETQPEMRPAEVRGPVAPARVARTGARPRSVLGKPRAEMVPLPEATRPPPGVEIPPGREVEPQVVAAEIPAPAAVVRAEDQEGRAAEKPRLLPLPAPNARRERAGVTTPAALDHWNRGLRALLPPASPDIAVIPMLEAIGDDPWTGGGVTARGVAAALKDVGPRDVEVHVNSGGGDMFEGIAIYNLLASHQGRVTVKVIGLAASAASIIAMAGDEVLMGEAAFMMIHCCQVLAAGNRHDMRETSDWLLPFDRAMADVYSGRTGQLKSQCLAWMDADKGDGTYFSAAEAIRLGFADGTLPTAQIVEDPVAAADGREKSRLLKAELRLCHRGFTRTEARALLNEVKEIGKQDAAGLRDGARPEGSGAAPEHRKPDAADTQSLLSLLGGLTQTLKS